jgi:hypothetical protein
MSMDLTFVEPKKLPERPKARLASLPCPRCGGMYQQGSPICDSCGVVLNRVNDMRAGPLVHGNQRLERLWENILDGYLQEGRHQEFIRRCAMENSLDFAAQKYRWILDVTPSDEMAMRMRQQVIELAPLHYMPSGKSKMLDRRIGWDLTSVFVATGSGLIVAGVMVPVFGNGLVGAGALLLTLTLLQRTFGLTNPRP